MRGSWTWLAAVVLAGACGDRGAAEGGTSGSSGTSTSTSTGTSSTGLTPTSTGGTADLGTTPEGSLQLDYCDPLAALICGRLVDCGCGALLPAETLDVASCSADYSAKCLEAYAPIAAAVAQGSAEILGDQARACVDLLAASTPGCERPRGAVTQALCPAWFTGDAAIGAACDFPICGGGQGLCVEGSCVAKPVAGAPCGPGGACAAGLLCIADLCAAPVVAGGVCAIDDACAPPLRCVAGVCAALKDAGATCADAAACAPGLLCNANACATRPDGACSADAPCGNLEFCATPRRCAALAGLGEGCDEDAACVAGTRCEAGACVANPGLDQPCANGVLCAAKLACDTDNGSCKPLPGAGEACAFAIDGPHVCAPPLGCVANVCGPLPQSGAECTVDSRCAAGLGCDFTPNGSICGPLKPIGGTCQTDRTCDVGLYCDYAVGQCAAVRPTGAACKDGNECGPDGTCEPVGGGAFACAPRPTVGERCVFECAAPLHCGSDLAAAGCAAEVCLEL